MSKETPQDRQDESEARLEEALWWIADYYGQDWRKEAPKELLDRIVALTEAAAQPQAGERASADEIVERCAFRASRWALKGAEQSIADDIRKLKGTFTLVGERDEALREAAALCDAWLNNPPPFKPDNAIGARAAVKILRGDILALIGQPAPPAPPASAKAEREARLEIGDEINQCLQIIVTNAGNIPKRRAPLEVANIENAVERAAKAVRRLAARTPEPAPALPVKAAAVADDLGHKTRFSDSSWYDEVCMLCGATDGIGDTRLTRSCPATPEEET